MSISDAAVRGRLCEDATNLEPTPVHRPARLPDPREKPWLTVAELSAITGEGEKTIRKAIEEGQLPELRVGRYVRIPTAALLARLGIEAAG